MNDRQSIAAVAAFMVRDSLEDLHAVKTVMDDDAMAKINPLVRDAIYTVLDLIYRASQGDAHAAGHLAYMELLIPDYWEPPALRQPFGFSQEEKTHD